MLLSGNLHQSSCASANLALPIYHPAATRPALPCGAVFGLDHHHNAVKHKQEESIIHSHPVLSEQRATAGFARVENAFSLTVTTYTFFDRPRTVKTIKQLIQLPGLVRQYKFTRPSL